MINKSITDIMNNTNNTSIEEKVMASKKIKNSKVYSLVNSTLVVDLNGIEFKNAKLLKRYLLL